MERVNGIASRNTRKGAPGPWRPRRSAPIDIEIVEVPLQLLDRAADAGGARWHHLPSGSGMLAHGPRGIWSGSRLYARETTARSGWFGMSTREKRTPG